MPVIIDFVDKPYVEITIIEGSSCEDINFAIKFAKYLRQNGIDVKISKIVKIARNIKYSKSLNSNP